jgi:putative ABC transport system permease protein
VDAEVVGVATGQTPVSSRSNWIAVDSSYADEIVGRDPVDRMVLVKLDAGATASGIDAELRAALGDTIRVQTPQGVIALIEEGPAAQGLRIALLVATALAALLGALAIVLTLALAAAPRERALALLRTLGVRPRASGGLIAWEVGPPTIAAVVAGLVFGALLPVVVLTAVDLRAFTGSTLQPAYRADAGFLAVLVGGFVVVAALFTVIAVFASRRVRAATVLRTMGEG